VTDAATSKVYGNKTVDQDGTFAVVPAPLPEGPVTLRLKESSQGESKDVSFIVNTTTTRFTAPAEGATVVDNGQITFAGTSAPFMSMRFMDGRRLLAQTTADAAGRWYVTFVRLPEYKYNGNASITAIDALSRTTEVHIIWK
jgi:hypothetical protein